MSGQVIGIFGAAESGAPMQGRTAGLLIEDLGLEGDRKAAAGSIRQLLMISVEVLRDFDLKPGDVRENLTVEGIDVMALQPGQQVRVGEALLEVTKAARGCEFMDRLRPGLRAAMAECRGMLFRVRAGGEIHLGDAVEVLA